MAFPPVRPLGARTPWSAPQTIEAVPEVRTIRPAIASGAIVQARPAAAVREAHRYAQINGSIVFSVSSRSSLALAAPQNFRNFLMMRNSGLIGILVDFGRDATSSSPLLLSPNQIILFDTVVPQDDIFVVSQDFVSSSELSVAFSNINFLEPVS